MGTGFNFLTGSIGGTARGYWHVFGVFPGARTRHASAQPSWRITRPPNRLSLYGRTRRHLHRIPQVPCKLRLLVLPCLFELPLILPPPTNWITAKLQRGRSISHAFPAMYDAGHDSDQNVLRRFAQSSYAGRLTAIIRTGKPFSARHHSSPSSFYLAH